VALQLAAVEVRPRGLRELTASLAPLGITKNDKGEADGTDVEPTIAAGAPWISLNQDGTRYFDYHTRPTTRSTRSIGTAAPERRRMDDDARILSGGMSRDRNSKTALSLQTREDKRCALHSPYRSVARRLPGQQDNGNGRPASPTTVTSPKCGEGCRQHRPEHCQRHRQRRPEDRQKDREKVENTDIDVKIGKDVHTNTAEKKAK